MQITLDPVIIYDKGLKDFDSLVGAERLVFMLQDFDNLMEMEGWEHFFLHEDHFAWYPEMKEWLRRIGDDESLEVLHDYESFVASQGFSFNSSGIGEMFDASDESSIDYDVDWCDRYSEFRDKRWAKASNWLESQGLKLEVG